MKECGIDTLSRSCPTEEVLMGENILSFLPLYKSVVERSGGLLSWIRSWWSKEEFIIHLTPNKWYSETFCWGNYILTPPSAVVDAAIGQFFRNVHLCPSNCHIVCIPRIMTGRWRTHLLKVADMLVYMPFDEHVWAKKMWTTHTCNYSSLAIHLRIQERQVCQRMRMDPTEDVD